LRSDLHTIGVLAGREFKMTMGSASTYTVLGLALGLAGWMLSNDVALVRSNGLLVHVAPFRGPLLGALLVLSFFLAVSAVLSVARDRDRGTLEVLFYGPIDEMTYLAGKLAGLLGAYGAIMPLLLAGLVVLSMFTRFEIGINLIAALALSIIPAAGIVAVGLLLSAAAKRVRSSILFFITAVGLFVGAAVSYSFVSRVPVEDPASPILPLRDALGAVDAVLSRISPFTYLEQIFDAADTGAWTAIGGSLALSLVGTIIAALLASLALRWRGVRTREE
jgi:ABC-type transport system involved in multi-copper enzyme maturation permease subunit